MAREDDIADSLVKIGRFDSAEEAELARDYLESQGIKAVSAGGADGLTVPMGGMLKVRKYDAKKAARLLKIAELRKKQDPALPLTRPFKLMVIGSALFFILLLILGLLDQIFGILKP